jgi:hypothetical protein
MGGAATATPAPTTGIPASIIPASRGDVVVALGPPQLANANTRLAVRRGLTRFLPL